MSEYNKFQHNQQNLQKGHNPLNPQNPLRPGIPKDQSQNPFNQGMRQDMGPQRGLPMRQPPPPVGNKLNKPPYPNMPNMMQNPTQIKDGQRAPLNNFQKPINQSFNQLNYPQRPGSNLRNPSSPRRQGFAPQQLPPHQQIQNMHHPGDGMVQPQDNMNMDLNYIQNSKAKNDEIQEDMQLYYTMKMSENTRFQQQQYGQPQNMPYHPPNHYSMPNMPQPGQNNMFGNHVGMHQNQHLQSESASVAGMSVDGSYNIQQSNDTSMRTARSSTSTNAPRQMNQNNNSNNNFQGVNQPPGPLRQPFIPPQMNMGVNQVKPPGMGIIQNQMNLNQGFNQQPTQQQQESIVAPQDKPGGPGTGTGQKARKTEKQQTLPQNNGDLSEYTMRVYWMTPLGRALNEAISEMQNLPQDLDKKIKHEFEKAIEKEFEHFSNNSNGKSSSSASKFKLQGNCKTYNNVYRVWNFNIENFTANFDDKTIKSEVDCKLISIPHQEFGERDNSNLRKATSKKQKKANRKQGGN